MRNKPLPVFFLLRMPLGRLAPPSPCCLPPARPIAVLWCCAFPSPRLAFRLSWRGAGTGRGASLVIAVRLSAAACLLGCFDCGGLPACSVGGAICVGNVMR